MATTKMAFMWRRRSSLLKIVIITVAVWCMLLLVFYSESNRRDSGQVANGQDNNDAIPMALKRDYDSMGQRDIKVNKRREGDHLANNNEVGDEEGDMPVISNEDEENAAELVNKRPQRQRWRKHNKPANNDNGEYISTDIIVYAMLVMTNDQRTNTWNGKFRAFNIIKSGGH